MAFDKLPEEILVRILSFLSRSDLLESALTCRRWAQAVAGPPLLRNIWLVIDDMEKAGPVFANTRRQYENLRVDTESLPDFDAAFWTNVGPSLRKLEFTSCYGSSKILFSIFQACCNLESLRLGNGNVSFKRELLTGKNVRSIQGSMRNLHHLHLGFNSQHLYTLEYLLVLMPNVSTVGLSLDGSESNLLSRLPKILGTSRKMTMLNLHPNRSGEISEQLLITSSASLRELKLRGDSLTRRALEALEYCTTLRNLIIDCVHLDARLLQKILGHVPELESLEISHSQGPPFTRRALEPLFDLKKLRKLDLSLRLDCDSRSCIPQELLRELARMLSLETLAVRGGVVDSNGFRILASLPKLRNLTLSFVKWDVESLKMILFESRKLRTLSIDVVEPWDRRYSRPEGDSEVDPQTLASVDRFGSDGQDELESSSLELLKFVDVPLTDACLDLIAAHHTRLKVLDFTSCEVITDAGLVTLLQHEPLLEEVKLKSNWNLNGEFLEALGELPCRRLRSLTVHTRASISSQAVEAFRLRKPRVKRRFSSSQ